MGKLYLGFVFFLLSLTAYSANYKEITIDLKSFLFKTVRPILIDENFGLPDSTFNLTNHPNKTVQEKYKTNTETGTLVIHFDKQVRDLFIWRDDVPTGRLYNNVGYTLIDYNEYGHYHLFSILQDTLGKIPSYYCILQKNINLTDSTDIHINHQTANLQAPQTHYHQNGHPIDATTIYRNKLNLYWAHLYDGQLLPLTINFQINDPQFNFYSNMLDDDFSILHIKMFYDKTQSLITYLQHYQHTIKSEHDLYLKDGPEYLHSYNIKQNLYNTLNKYLMFGGTVYHDFSKWLSCKKQNLSFKSQDNLPFTGTIELSESEYNTENEKNILTAYNIIVGGSDSLTNNPVLTWQPSRQIHLDGSMIEFKHLNPWYYNENIELFTDNVHLNTLQENDSLLLENNPSNILFPAFTCEKSSSTFYRVYYYGDASAGLECANGHFVYNYLSSNKSRITDVRVFTDNYQVDNQKIIGYPEDIYKYNFYASQNTSFTCILNSSPYHIINKYGHSQLNFYGNSTSRELPFLYHIDIRSNNHITPHVIPGQSNIINFYLLYESTHTNQSLQITNADTTFDLLINKISDSHFQAVIPENLPFGHYDLCLKILDHDILGTVFTATPAFYHAPRDRVPEPTTSLYLSDYKTINNNTLLPSGTIDNLTLLLKNIGKVKATNIYISSSDSSFLQIMQEKSIPILQPNEGSELQIPVMLKPGYSTSTIIPIRLDLLFETNGQKVKQPLHLIFGTPDIQSNITNENVAITEDFKLLGSYPNPVRQSNGKGCTLQIQLNKAASVRIDIYNILGQHVNLIEKQLSTGTHNIYWQGLNSHKKSLGNGLYFYKIKISKKIITGKILLID